MMSRDDLAAWAQANGWIEKDGHPIWEIPETGVVVRMVFLARMVRLEQLCQGEWHRMSSAYYSIIEPDKRTGIPRGIGLYTRLMGFEFRKMLARRNTVARSDDDPSGSKGP
jgi:hypothetical protein